MSVKERAVSLHGAGFNCAQGVLCSCGAYTGLDEKTALAVSGGLGGGFRCGEICGALSGAILAAGLSRRLGSGEAPPEGLHNKLIIKGDKNE